MNVREGLQHLAGELTKVTHHHACALKPSDAEAAEHYQGLITCLEFFRPQDWLLIWLAFIQEMPLNLVEDPQAHRVVSNFLALMDMGIRNNSLTSRERQYMSSDRVVLILGTSGQKVRIHLGQEGYLEFEKPIHGQTHFVLSEYKKILVALLLEFPPEEVVSYDFIYQTLNRCYKSKSDSDHNDNLRTNVAVFNSLLRKAGVPFQIKTQYNRGLYWQLSRPNHDSVASKEQHNYG